MGIDTLDLGDGWPLSSESGSESSEAYKAKLSQALSNIRKSQTDEGKAQAQDDELVAIIIAIISDEAYYPLLEPLYAAFSIDVPSHAIIAALSLAHPLAERTVLRYAYPHAKGEAWEEGRTFVYTITPEVQPFNDHTLPEVLRGRINAWVDDASAALTQSEVSFIASQKFVALADDAAAARAIARLFAAVLRFFLLRLNIRMEEKHSYAYGEFILGEVAGRVRRDVLPHDIFRDQ